MKIRNILEIMTLVVLAAVIFLSACSALSEHPLMQETKYTVESGDCLWTIAKAFCPSGMSEWQYIDALREVNNLSSYTIYPGQVLTVYETVK